MNRFLIYKYNDMYGFFTRGLTVIDYLSSLYINKLVSAIGPILTDNLLILINILLSFGVGVILYKKLKTSLYTALVFSFLYAVSNYFIFRVMSLTPALYYIFLFPLTFILLLNKRSPVLMSIITLLILGFANYYGFFIFIIISSWYLYDLIVDCDKRKQVLKNSLVYIILTFSLVVLFFSKTFINNTFFFGRYKPYKLTSPQIVKTFYRPIDDFYSFTFRPWYFFIPPKNSIYFGSFSKTVYEKISSTNYYLADDYADDEMAGSYVGWHFILGYLAAIILVMLSKKSEAIREKFKVLLSNKNYAFRASFILLIILLLSGPPTFTVRGVTFYTPSYILYYLVPVFRTLVRLSAVIYLIVLSVNALLFNDLLELVRNKYIKTLVVVLFIILNYLIFAIKIPIIDTKNPPEDIKKFQELTVDSKLKYIVYPKVDYYSLFWSSFGDNIMVDPSDYSIEKSINPSKNTDLLITKEGLLKAKLSGINYLLYYPEKVDNLKEIKLYNSEIIEKIDIKIFFDKFIGEPLKFGDTYVYKIN